jgi:hypothetical protein
MKTLLCYKHIETLNHDDHNFIKILSIILFQKTWIHLMPNFKRKPNLIYTSNLVVYSFPQVHMLSTGL